MPLTGANNEEKIRNYLKGQGLSDYAIYGLMGNLYAESGLNPINLQNPFEGKLGYTDASYTAAVDHGIYTKFVKDGAGYGLAQWTYWSRKQALLAHAKGKHKSIGDLEMQLEFLLKELTDSGLLMMLNACKSVLEASNLILLKFEKPAGMNSASVQAKRAGYGQAYYDKYEKATVNTGGTTMTEKELRAKVVSIAQKYLGCKESNDSHRKIIDRYNGHKPLARGYAVKYTDAWCATFVSAVFIEAGLTDIAPTECGCGKMIDLYKKLNCWEENDAYVPSAGDVIMYDWQDSGAGDNTGAPDHVGIVVSVSGKAIKIIEGNKNNAVDYRTLQVNGKYIRGYCLPKYSSKASGTASPTGAAPSDQPAASPMMAKKAFDAAKAFNKALAGTYIVTANSGLHVRDGAGTNKASLVVLPKGTKVKNYGYYTLAGGIKWLYIQVTYQGVTYTGFCSAQYLSK